MSETSTPAPESAPLVWIDCEMTGLHPQVDELVEGAVLITDAELNILDEGIDLVIRPSAAALEQMDPFVRDMHTTSGLLPELAEGLETADIALMGDRLERLPQALDLARRTVRVMRQNIAISLVTVVALLAGVFAGGVTMAVGMLVHEASVLLVIVNAMRLLRRPGQPRSTTSNSSRSAPVATGAGRPPCSAA